MTLQESFKILNIEDYSDRIFNSNSHGELFFLQQYFNIAEFLKDDPSWFREWFIMVVKNAEKTWSRPESVFQHIDKILLEFIEKNNN